MHTSIDLSDTDILAAACIDVVAGSGGCNIGRGAKS